MSDFLLVIVLSVALVAGIAMVLGLAASLLAGVSRGVFGHRHH